MTTTTTNKTITALSKIFSRNSIPRQIVSDNGPQFVSEEFSQFMSANGIKHNWSSQYHPSSNVAAEQLVQTLKRALRAGHAPFWHATVTVSVCFSTPIFQYSTTPHATTRVSPCSLLMGRPTTLAVSRYQCASTEQRDAAESTSLLTLQDERELEIGQPVWARNFQEGPSWI